MDPFLDESMVSLSGPGPGRNGASAVVSVTSSPGGVTVGSGGQITELPAQAATHIFVTKH